MLNSSELEDYDTVPPPLDWEDENWDDDVLPPPSACVSERDDMSVVSRDPSEIGNTVVNEDLHESRPLNPSRWLPDQSEIRSQPEPIAIRNDDLLYSPPLTSTSTTEAQEISPVLPDNTTDLCVARAPMQSESTPKNVVNDAFCKCDSFGSIGETKIFEDLKPYVSPPKSQSVEESAPVSRPVQKMSEVRSSETISTPNEILEKNVVSPQMTTRYKTDKSLPQVLGFPPPEEKPQHNTFPDIDLMRQRPLEPSQEFFYPKPPMSPEPSAPFETNDSEESESTLAAILNALDPSERTAFLVEQNKILENIQMKTSDEEASREMAQKMMAMEQDAELARKLQEEEHSSVNRASRTIRDGSDATRRAIRDGRTTIAQCWSCHKSMHVPKGTRRAYCPVCKSVCLFEDKSKKSHSRGLFGRRKMKK